MYIFEFTQGIRSIKVKASDLEEAEIKAMRVICYSNKSDFTMLFKLTSIVEV